MDMTKEGIKRGFNRIFFEIDLTDEQAEFIYELQKLAESKLQEKQKEIDRLKEIIGNRIKQLNISIDDPEVLDQKRVIVKLEAYKDFKILIDKIK
jgi:hypothetical protein